MYTALLENLLVVVLMQGCVWVVSLFKRDVSIVDLFWSLGFIAIGLRSVVVVNGATPLAWLLLGMVGAWGLRLSCYLTWRNWGEPEDYRYAKMREYWGVSFPAVSLFSVFTLQAFLTWIVALPVQTGILLGGDIGFFAWIGVFIWLVGLVFESVGDWQLARFKSDDSNKGRVLDQGLWRYTRHPNYFGDFLVWWGIYVASLDTGFVWWTILGPIVMSVLLMKVSGVTLLESALKARKAGYHDYTRRTNAFFPWFPEQPG